MGYIDRYENYTPFGATDSKTQEKIYCKESHSFANAYTFYRNYLFEKVMLLFKWEGLPETIPQKEIESRLLLEGICAVYEFQKGRPIATSCNLFGVTDYYDEFTHANLITPRHHKRVKVDGCAIIDNNSLRNSVCHIIHRYAIALAHCDVTMIDSIVNKRMDTVITVRDSVTSEKARKFYNDLYAGRFSVIDDEFFSDLKFNQFANSSIDYLNAYELQRNLLGAFFESFGIATPYRKKGNMTEEEINRNNDLLLVNIKDMLYCRELGAKKISDYLGTPVSVKLDLKQIDNELGGI